MVQFWYKMGSKFFFCFFIRYIYLSGVILSGRRNHRVFIFSIRRLSTGSNIFLLPFYRLAVNTRWPKQLWSMHVISISLMIRLRNRMAKATAKSPLLLDGFLMSRISLLCLEEVSSAL